VARLSRQRARGLCRIGAIDPCTECRILVPSRGDQEPLGPIAAVAFAASGGMACTPKRMAEHCLRHDRQRYLGQQLHSSRLLAVPAEISLGVAQYALLAKTRVTVGRSDERIAQAGSGFSARWPNAAGLICFGASRCSSFAAREGLSPQATGLNGLAALVARPKSNVKSPVYRKHGETPKHVKNAAARSYATTAGRAYRA
jgi:hypothetical protein